MNRSGRNRQPNRAGNQPPNRVGNQPVHRNGNSRTQQRNPQANSRNRQNPYGQNPQYGDPRYRQRSTYISPEERARREAVSRARREEAERRRQEQLAYERKIKEREKQIRRKEFRENVKIIFGRLLVFLIVLVILTLLALGVFLIAFHNSPHEPADSGKITYYFGGEEIRTAPAKDTIVGKSVYFCFNDLSDYLEMSESGTAQEMKFILPKNGILPETAAGNGLEESIVFLSDASKVILNGQVVELDVPNILRGTEIWVSTEFVTDYIENLSLSYDADKREMHISRIKDEENSTENLTLYLAPNFKLKNADPIDAILEDPLVGDVAFSTDPNADDGSVVLKFATDVSAYESYMNPEGDLRDAFLTIYSEENPASAPTDLREVSQTSIISETQYLSEYTARALDALFNEMRAEEYYSMAVYKGYSAADTADEHASGLAVDMDTLGCVTADFQYQPEYTWLQENAWKFGFILRYPKDKTKETDHEFEPWHYRFVGRYHAQKIHASGLCLEEYLEGIE